MDKLLIRPAEAATALGISKSKMYELLSSRTIPSVRIGKAIRVPVDSLKKWVQSQVEGSRDDDSSAQPS